MATLGKQMRAAVQNGLLRPGADETYADGDDAAWMGIDWRAMMRRETVFGRGVHLIDSGGEGPALVYIHGLGGVWQNWLLNIPPFLDSHRVIAMDLPGFGESEMPEGEISIRHYAAVVDQLLDQIGIESASVVGNSMGGFIGAELALSFDTRVERLVLVSAAGLSIEYQRREPLLTLARLTAPLNVHLIAQYREFFITRPRLRRAVLQSVVRYPEKLSAPLTWEQMGGTGKPGFVDALEALMSYSFRERLEELEIPVLIVWGENDLLVPVGDAERFERLIGANARKEIFEDTGHVPMMERPTRFNDLLRGFLAEESAPEQGVEGVHA